MKTNEILEFASQQYEFQKNTLQFISNSTNQIYMFTKQNKSYILRFSAHPPEYIHQVKAEMDWLYYLKRQNLSVSLPLKTLQGKFATCVENEGETYILSAFEKADGQNWDKNDPQRWNAAVFNH